MIVARAIRWSLIVLLAAAHGLAWADTYPRQPGVDVLGYVFRLTLSDTSDVVEGEALVDVRFLASGATGVELDLASPTPEAPGRGMTVTGVFADGGALDFTHARDRLAVGLQRPAAAGERRRFTVRYRGIPATGLVIGPNKHGDRGFFTDNWPDKARQWLPVVDHPSDKATCEFDVTAPARYQVVSNGLQVEETDLGDGRRRTRWVQSVPIASWLYVLGVSPFAVDHRPAWRGIPVQTWVYPQDRDAGFHDFAVPSTDVLEFYATRIGPYAYEKLANVQSNSVGGGMEAATAVFYDDDSVTGQRTTRWRNVVIHEIAHHWWGNAVTERDWDDVWLSEGFATYFTLLFIEHAYGRDEFVQGLLQSRDSVRAFDTKRPGYRLVHDNLADMGQVTTSQTYQKGGWTLHMLRGLVGDEAFWAGIRAYYARYLNANASTADFRRTMEETTGRDLGWFFDQWLYRPGGFPKVRGTWRFDAAARAVRLELEQVQPEGPYQLPVEVSIRRTGAAQPTIERIELRERRQVVSLPADEAPDAVTLDPGTWVLMDVELVRDGGQRE
jgi:aminopeptidase N